MLDNRESERLTLMTRIDLTCDNILVCVLLSVLSHYVAYLNAKSLLALTAYLRSGIQIAIASEIRFCRANTEWIIEQLMNYPNSINCNNKARRDTIFIFKNNYYRTILNPVVNKTNFIVTINCI